MFALLKDKLWQLRGVYCIIQSINKRYFSPKNKKLYGYYGREIRLQVPCFITDFGSVYLGDYSHIRYGFNLINTPNVKFIMGKYCVIGPNCTVVTGNHAQTIGVPQSVGCSNHINDDDKDVVFEDSVWLGANVTVLSGVTIGRGSVIGAGTVVNKSLPPYCVAVGTPARIIATTFTINEILLHESRIYVEEERLSNEYLENLFGQQYSGLKSIGIKSVPVDKRTVFEENMHRMNLV